MQKRVSRIIRTFVGCPDIPLFSALSHKRHGYRGENILEHRLCFNFLYRIRVCLKYFSFCEEFSETRSKMYIGFYVMYPLLMSDLNENLNFLHTLGKYSDIKSHENPTSGAELFHAGCRVAGWPGRRMGRQT